jgi:hypothetical protein
MMKLDFMRTCASIADLVLPLRSDFIAYWEIFDDIAKAWRHGVYSSGLPASYLLSL